MTLATGRHRRLWNYLKPYWGLELGTFLTMVVLTGLAIAMPIALQYMIDTLIPRLTASARPVRIAPVVTFSAVLVGIYLADVLACWVRDYLAGRVGAGIIRDMRSELYAHLQRLSLRFFHEHQVGEIMSRLLSDVGRVQDLLTSTLLMLITNALMLLAILAYLIHTNWLLTLAAVIPVPLTIVSANRFGIRLNSLAFDIQRKLAELSARIQEAFLSIKVIKAFGQEEREQRGIDDVLGRLTRVYVRNSVMSSLAANVVQFVNMVGPIVVLGWGVYLVAAGTMKLGQLIAFYILLTYLYGPIHGLAQTSIQVQSAMASVDRVFEYLDVPTAVAEAPRPVTIGRLRGEIDFQDVSFTYSDSDFSLNHFSLHIRAGEKVALVGPSGSGKTSIANLVMRFFDPDAGAVTLDGIDLRSLSLRSLRSAVSLVEQDPLLFNASIAENLKYGRPEASPAEVVTAAKAAGVHDFIMSLPNGYDGGVAERGVTVSGGERQRICLARAILVNPRILILDEATSALDSATEHLIQESLRRVLEDKTAIIIAHRLSTVRYADRIVVLEAGRIVAEGTHEDLIERCPAYRELAARQMLVNA